MFGPDHLKQKVRPGKIEHFAPALILRCLSDTAARGEKVTPPLVQRMETVAMFADISGFTRLSELAAAEGGLGAEKLGFWLDRYFEMLVEIVGGAGGDVFKFAGDAMLIVWPPTRESSIHTVDFTGDDSPGVRAGLSMSSAALRDTCLRAVECAIAIQTELNDVSLDEGVQFRIKLGLGVGTVNVMHVGGVFGRLEFLCTGDAVRQAFLCEHECKPGGTVVSEEMLRMAGEAMEYHHLESGRAVVSSVTQTIRRRSLSRTLRPAIAERVSEMLRSYVPAAILPHLNSASQQWASELRTITVMFVNLGFNPDDLHDVRRRTIQKVKAVLRAVQSTIYQHEGSLNKFLVDDKGSTLLAATGLPPLAHEDDPERAVLAAVMLVRKLRALKQDCYIGVTSGIALCGSVGSGNRREYSVFGDVVNTGARLMQAAKDMAMTSNDIFTGRVLCDNATKTSAQVNPELMFEELPPIHLKGKAGSTEIYQPGKRVKGTGVVPVIWDHQDITLSTGFGGLDVDLIDTVDAMLNDGMAPSPVVIGGENGCGKSTLLRQFVRVCVEAFGAVLGVPMLDPDMPDEQLYSVMSTMQSIFSDDMPVDMTPEEWLATQAAPASARTRRASIHSALAEAAAAPSRQLAGASSSVAPSLSTSGAPPSRSAGDESPASGGAGGPSAGESAAANVSGGTGSAAYLEDLRRGSAAGSGGSTSATAPRRQSSDTKGDAAAGGTGGDARRPSIEGGIAAAGQRRGSVELGRGRRLSRDSNASAEDVPARSGSPAQPPRGRRISGGGRSPQSPRARRISGGGRSPRSPRGRRHSAGEPKARVSPRGGSIGRRSSDASDGGRPALSVDTSEAGPTGRVTPTQGDLESGTTGGRHVLLAEELEIARRRRAARKSVGSTDSGSPATPVPLLPGMSPRRGGGSGWTRSSHATHRFDRRKRQAHKFGSGRRLTRTDSLFSDEETSSVEGSPQRAAMMAGGRSPMAHFALDGGRAVPDNDGGETPSRTVMFEGTPKVIDGDTGEEPSPTLAPATSLTDVEGAVGPYPLRLLYGVGHPFKESIRTYVWRQIIHQLTSDVQCCFAEEDLPEVAQLVSRVRRQELFSADVEHERVHEVEKETLLRLVALHARITPLAILLDQMQAVGDTDWELAHDLSEFLDSNVYVRCFLVIFTRPLHFTKFQPKFRQVPQKYFALMGMLSTEYWELQSMSKEDTKTLVKVTLGLSHVPSRLVTLVYNMTNGNPRFVRKFLQALLHVGIVELQRVRRTDRRGSGGSVEGVPDERGSEVQAKLLLRHGDFLPVPYQVQRVIATYIDRLTASQILVLKVASVLAVGAGQTVTAFDLNLLMGILPDDLIVEGAKGGDEINVRDEVLKEIDVLIQFGLVRVANLVLDAPKHRMVAGAGGLARWESEVSSRKDSAESASASRLSDSLKLHGSESRAFSFTCGLMRDVVYHRMLHKQREDAHGAAAEFIESFIAKLGDRASSFTFSIRELHKHVFRHLKLAGQRERAHEVYEKQVARRRPVRQRPASTTASSGKRAGTFEEAAEKRSAKRKSSVLSSFLSRRGGKGLTSEGDSGPQPASRGRHSSMPFIFGRDVGKPRVAPLRRVGTGRHSGTVANQAGNSSAKPVSVPTTPTNTAKKRTWMALDVDRSVDEEAEKKTLGDAWKNEPTLAVTASAHVLDESAAKGSMPSLGDSTDGTDTLPDGFTMNEPQVKVTASVYDFGEALQADGDDPRLQNMSPTERREKQLIPRSPSTAHAGRLEGEATMMDDDNSGDSETDEEEEDEDDDAFDTDDADVTTLTDGGTPLAHPSEGAIALRRRKLTSPTSAGPAAPEDGENDDSASCVSVLIRKVCGGSRRSNKVAVVSSEPPATPTSRTGNGRRLSEGTGRRRRREQLGMGMESRRRSTNLLQTPLVHTGSEFALTKISRGEFGESAESLPGSAGVHELGSLDVKDLAAAGKTVPGLGLADDTRPTTADAGSGGRPTRTATFHVGGRRFSVGEAPPAAFNLMSVSAKPAGSPSTPTQSLIASAGRDGRSRSFIIPGSSLGGHGHGVSPPFGHRGRSPQPPANVSQDRSGQEDLVEPGEMIAVDLKRAANGSPEVPGTTTPMETPPPSGDGGRLRGVDSAGSVDERLLLALRQGSPHSAATPHSHSPHAVVTRRNSALGIVRSSSPKVARDMKRKSSMSELTGSGGRRGGRGIHSVQSQRITALARPLDVKGSPQSGASVSPSGSHSSPLKGVASRGGLVQRNAKGTLHIVRKKNSVAGSIASDAVPEGSPADVSSLGKTEYHGSPVDPPFKARGGRRFSTVDDVGGYDATAFVDDDPFDDRGSVASRASMVSGVSGAPSQLSRVGSETALATAMTQSAHNLDVAHQRFGTFLQRHEADTARLARVLSKIDSWDFDVFTLTHITEGKPLEQVLPLVFAKRGLLHKLGVTREVLVEFSSAVAASYDPENCYHCSIKAADCVQATHVLLQKVEHYVELSHLQVASALIAAAVLDLRHPGVDTRFLAQTGDPIIQQFGDRSLERYHLHEAMLLMESVGPTGVSRNVLGGLPLSQQEMAKHIVSELVLASCMQDQFEFVTRLAALIDHGDFPHDEEEKLALLALVVKVADMNHNTRPFHTAKLWVDRVSTEFFAQGDRERALGLRVSNYKDRDTARIAQVQLVFVTFFVQPLTELLGEVAPSARDMYKSLLDANIHFWQEQDKAMGGTGAALVDNVMNRAAGMSSGSMGRRDSDSGSETENEDDSLAEVGDLLAGASAVVGEAGQSAAREQLAKGAMLTQSLHTRSLGHRAAPAPVSLMPDASHSPAAEMVDTGYGTPRTPGGHVAGSPMSKHYGGGSNSEGATLRRVHTGELDVTGDAASTSSALGGGSRRPSNGSGVVSAGAARGGAGDGDGEDSAAAAAARRKEFIHISAPSMKSLEHALEEFESTAGVSVAATGSGHVPASMELQQQLSVSDGVVAPLASSNGSGEIQSSMSMRSLDDNRRRAGSHAMVMQPRNPLLDRLRARPRAQSLTRDDSSFDTAEDSGASLGGTPRLKRGSSGEIRAGPRDAPDGLRIRLRKFTTEQGPSDGPPVRDKQHRMRSRAPLTPIEVLAAHIDRPATPGEVPTARQRKAQRVRRTLEQAFF